MYELDELQIYRGKEIKINKNISIRIPLLTEIADFGERRYFSAVHNITSVGADLKWQLWELGIDYTQIEDYDLFIRFISQIISSKKDLHDDIVAHPEKYDKTFDEEELQDLLINPMELVLVDIDFADYQPFYIESTKQVVLYNRDKDITFDRVAYTRVVEVIRNLHGFKRNNQIPANERTKMDLIEDARDEAMLAATKPFHSILKPLISTLQVSCGQCGDNRILDMPISAFFDNIKRVGKIQDATLLLQGAYSGFANLKGIDKSRLDMFGELQ